jgi:hypothetical protein
LWESGKRGSGRQALALKGFDGWIKFVVFLFHALEQGAQDAVRFIAKLLGIGQQMRRWRRAGA